VGERRRMYSYEEAFGKLGQRQKIDAKEKAATVLSVSTSKTSTLFGNNVDRRFLTITKNKKRMVVVSF